MIEAIQIHGQDLIYIPRNVANFDQLFGEDPTSYFKQFAIIEMYLESWDKFEGKDDFMSKFGLRTEEIAQFRVSRRRFEEVIGQAFPRTLPNNNIRPNEGDLLYYPMDRNLFEIKFVTLKDSFYQLDDYYSYVLSCALFQYSSEVIDTGVQDIQNSLPNSLDNLLYPFVGTGESLLIDPNSADLASVNIGTNAMNQVDYDTANKKLFNDNSTISNFSEHNPFGLTNMPADRIITINPLQIPPTAFSDRDNVFNLVFNSNTTTQIGVMRQNDIIETIFVNVLEPFNGTTTLKIGSQDILYKYVEEGDVDLTQSVQYEINCNIIVATTENIIATYTTNGSTTGMATIVINYSTPR